MAFQVPTFNLTCNIWRSGNAVTNPPDLSPACNLAHGKDVNVSLGPAVPTGGAGFSQIPFVQMMHLLLPALTDIRGFSYAVINQADNVECPAGSGRFYCVMGVDDVGKGFPNEYRKAVLLPLNKGLSITAFNQCSCPSGWPVPMP